MEHGVPLFPKLLEPGAEPSAAAVPGATPGGNGGKSANALAAVAGKAKKDAEKAEMKAKQVAAAAAKAAADGGAAPAAADAAAPKAAEAAAEGSGKKEKKGKGEKAPKGPKGGAAPAAAEEEVEDCCKLDLRVGRIVEAWPHPDSEKLWVEQIDVGEPSGPRNICSGLRAFYATAEDLVGQPVVVVANLKNKKMGGVDSFGMVTPSY